MFGLPFLTILTAKHPWKLVLPADHLNNALILSIEGDQPITETEAIYTINFIWDNNRTECAIQICKRQAHNSILLKECRNVFDNFDRANLSSIWTPEIKYLINSLVPVI